MAASPAQAARGDRKGPEPAGPPPSQADRDRLHLAAVADVVTCSQAFHWMPREAVTREVARILRPGGVFAVYDYDLLPAVHPEVDLALARVCEQAGVEAERRAKATHLAHLRHSGRFRLVREVCLHGRDRGDTGRLLTYVHSLGPVARALTGGATEADLGLDVLRELAGRVLGSATTFWWSYRVRLGIV